MNLPNKLTCARMALIPFFLFFLIFPEIITENPSRIIAAVIFALTAFTDMLDGKIARKYNLVTDFGKFMDPLADKLMVFGAMIGILVLNTVTGTPEMAIFNKVFAVSAFIIIFRELAVTSMRMVVSSAEGIVIAANIFGKLKTVSQIIGIVVILVEPVIYSAFNVACVPYASYVMLGIMVFTTLFSGFNYFKAYWPHINSNK